MAEQPEYTEGKGLEPPLSKDEANLVQTMVDLMKSGEAREFAVAVELRDRRVFSIISGHGSQLIEHTGLRPRSSSPDRGPKGEFSEDELTAMSAHLKYFLRRNQIKTWEHLASLSESDLRKFKNVGDTTVKRIQAWLLIKRGRS